MGVEGGSLGSISPAAGSIGPVVSAGPNISVSAEAGLSARFGPSIGLESLSSPIVNEGPVRGGLKMFKPIGQINFIKSELNATDAVSEAQSILSQAHGPQEPLSVPAVIAEAELVITQAQRLGIDTVTPDVIPVSPVIPAEAIGSEAQARRVGIHIDNYLWIPDPFGLAQGGRVGDDKPVESIITPQIEPMIVSVVTLPENAVGVEPTEISRAVLQQPILEEQEEVIKEKVIVGKDEVVKPEVKKKEDSFLLKVKFVEAVVLSEKRRKEISAAAKRLIGKYVGRALKDFLSVGFWGSKSPVVGEGKDWTIDLTVQEIESDPTEYKTPEVAAKAWVKAVERNIPVKEGVEGRQATFGELRKVTNGEDELLKLKTPAEIVIRRIVKKGMQAAPKDAGISAQKPVEVVKAEPTLEELNQDLAGVFQKAA